MKCDEKTGSCFKITENGIFDVYEKGFVLHVIGTEDNFFDCKSVRYARIRKFEIVFIYFTNVRKLFEYFEKFIPL